MSRQAGFTLAELAIVMLVFSILLGGMFVSLSTQLDLRSISDTQRNMDQAREALIGYAVANGRLPCPAAATSNVANTSGSSGTEALTGSDCTSYFGYVPAVTLGITPTDAQGFLIDSWGSRVRYAVANVNSVHTFTTATPASQIRAFGISNLPAPGAESAGYFYLRVCSTATGITNVGTANEKCGATSLLTNGAVAIVFSEGRNARTGGGAGIDEARNLDSFPAFVFHDRTDSTVANGEFDDLLTWLSPNILYNRLIAAGAI
jgi:prepilin-type N-terminal cleavage/methylation domain-containing protein